MKAAPLFAIAILAIAAPALGRDRPIPAATPDGKAENCVQTSMIQQMQVRSDKVIDFQMRNGKVYRNTLASACPRLGFEQRIAYRSTNSQLCSIDMITVLTGPGISPGASCGLGEFQPVKLAK